MPQVNTGLDSLAKGITTNNPLINKPLPGGGHKQVPNPHYKGPNAYRMDAKGKLSLIKDATKRAGPLTQLMNSPLVRYAGTALTNLSRAYGGYELLRPGATTSERLLGGASIISPYSALAINGLGYVDDKLETDRGKAFTQAMNAGYGNQALRHLFGNYQRVDGLTPDVIDAKPDIGKLKELIVKNAQALPKVEMKVGDEPPVPPVPQLSLGEQLQQERDTLGLTPMQQWAKAHPELANKVKEGQSGFQDIKALFDAEDTGIVGAEDTGRTPKDMLAINTTGLETLIGPDGIGESKPYEPESFRSEKMAGNRIFNLINPVK